MKQTELRIGNYVMNDRIVNTVTSIGKRSIGQITTQGNDILSRTELIKPIPITEEWLIKFGFEKRTPDGYYFDKGRMSINLPDVYYKINFTLVKIYYIHQLQNLYFALTNKELTI